ncbi:hypothetical protein [Actinoplanes subtropicus]|uniref:hypothetical protein n=1 Tax=Actinoplanes subtropicus TaxID=543632 RepID=UPI0004C3621B|nr:hypothetical protein [Actinoplanes subtropicus]
MEQNWRHLPSPARPIAAAATVAVEAAQRRDEESLAAAAGDLAALDPGQTGLVLGTLVRVLLEDTHPDGLDGEAVRAVLERSVRSAGWQAEVDPHVLLVLLAGALGVIDEDDETPPPKPDVLARHAALLTAELLGPRPPRPFLDATFTEIERAQLND